MDMVETISKVKAEELREQYRQSAFIAYLITGGEEGASFAEFLERIGLDDKSGSGENPPVEGNNSKEEALAKAESIIAMFKQGFQRGGVDG